jgi:hypothetical protein
MFGGIELIFFFGALTIAIAVAYWVLKAKKK